MIIKSFLSDRKIPYFCKIKCKIHEKNTNPHTSRYVLHIGLFPAIKISTYGLGQLE